MNGRNPPRIPHPEAAPGADPLGDIAVRMAACRTTPDLNAVVSLALSPFAGTWPTPLLPPTTRSSC